MAVVAPSRSFLSPRRRRTLAAVVAAVRPRGSGFDHPLDDYVLEQIEGFLPFLPVTLRLGLPLGLDLIEFGPPLFARRLTRFSRMPLDEAGRYLAHWQESTDIRGALMLGLRTLVFLAFYQHPDVLKTLGVDWQGRADLLVRRRAELLAGNEHAA